MDTLTELIPTLRLRIGDTDPATYKYLDSWLLIALVASVRSLERYWDSKYTTDDSGIVTRNPDYDYFEFEDTDGIIQSKDEIIIVLKAALIVLEGSLENHAWDLGSWRDAEISYSNIAGGSTRESTIKRIQDELDLYIKSPSRRLTKSHRMRILETNK